MQIQSLFIRQINRSINGVIKADQADEASIWQELEEYVVTRELDEHFRKFFDSYLQAIDNPKAASGRSAVWISGFFGSGKSHFLKILSYLLENKAVSNEGETRRASEFFESKISDPMLAADIERALSKPADVLLFNIDSKADTNDGRSALLNVFLSVFNEKLGYSPDHPAIAHMERYLDEKGRYQAFKDAFEKHNGEPWLKERIAYQFHADDIGAALSEVLGKEITDADGWIERFEQDFDLTVDNLAKWIKHYLDAQPDDRRIVFLVDEIGQFIGQDTHLMLSLQTIAEKLGTACEGRAWLVVTSQEDIDAVIGEVRSSKANDFSKIQGRFVTRLSLSSGNVDEVIEKRLLDKPGDVKDELRQLYREKADILKNQLSFTNTGRTFKTYTDEDNFASVYPFKPYQFQLVQRIFESIRKAGATGLHLARGERSLLDAFQQAASTVLHEEVGVLVPLYRFYPAIESFLEGVVKSTIDNVTSNPVLTEFDQQLLKTLFLIRYVDEIKGNVDNLVTLFIDQIDADRQAIRTKIEASLQRLEKESLINRSGENFFFLTNEERDITKEIKQVEVSSADEAKELGTLVFAEVLKDQRRYRYPGNGKDMTLSRLCDFHPYGGRTEGDLVVSVISPMSEDHTDYSEAKCIMASGDGQGLALLRLPNDIDLGRELRTWLQTDRFVRLRMDASLPSSTQQILRARREENDLRWKRLINIVERLLTEADVYVAGSHLQLSASAASTLLDKALAYLVENTFTKLSYLQHLAKDPQREIKALLSTPVNESLGLEITEQANPQALKDVADYLAMADSLDKRITLTELIDQRYAKRPYGWPEWETLLLVARLYMNGEVSLLRHDSPLAREAIWPEVQTPNKWGNLRIIKRKTVDTQALANARKLAKDVLQALAPEGEDALDAFLREHFSQWQQALGQWHALAKNGQYPGLSEIEALQQQLAEQQAITDSYPYIGAFLDAKNAWLDASDTYQDLHNFYTKQRTAWESLRQAENRFKLNESKLLEDPAARQALTQISTILSAPAPYGMLHQGESLVNTVEAVNQQLLGKYRTETLAFLQKQIDKVTQTLNEADAEPELRNKSLLPLQQRVKQVENEHSIAHLLQMRTDGRDDAGEAIDHIQHLQQQKLEQASQPKPSSSVTSTGNLQAQPASIVGEGKVTVAKPIKPRKVVTPADLTDKAYLENRQDVDAFINKLRNELDAILSEGGRIEIR